MAKEIEIEAKNLLTKQEFDTLIKAFSLKPTDFLSQTNHYFETSDFSLKKQHSALRIREKDKQFTLTLKQPHHVGLMETNQTITKEDKEQLIENRIFPIGEVKDALLASGIPLEQLLLLGSLTTSRAEFSYEDGTLFLDHSYYLGKEDYELEYEGNDAKAVQQTFTKLLETFHIPKRNTINKIARFFQYKIQIEKDNFS